MRRIDGERGQDRKHVKQEMVLQPVHFRLREFADIDDDDTRLIELTA